jgi:hypothetical protein
MSVKLLYQISAIPTCLSVRLMRRTYFIGLGLNGEKHSGRDLPITALHWGIPHAATHHEKLRYRHHLNMGWNAHS